MDNEQKSMSVEDNIYRVFFRRLEEDSDLDDEVIETLRHLHEDQELDNSSDLAQSIFEASTQGDEANAS